MSARALVKKVVFDRVPGLRRRGPVTTRRVAITFDDGPDDLTPRYLDMLDQLGVRASFFLVGNACARHPELVREYVRRGHHVAAHGYDHTRFTELGRRALLDQCDRTDRALANGATDRAWVRPPYGAVDAASLLTLRLAGYTVALWSVDSLDYEDRDASSVAARCAPPHVSNGDVLLFHEGQPWTLDAVPTVVERLRGAGFELATMPDLYAR